MQIDCYKSGWELYEAFQRLVPVTNNNPYLLDDLAGSDQPPR